MLSDTRYAIRDTGYAIKLPAALLTLFLLAACAAPGGPPSPPNAGEIRVAIVPPGFTSPFHVAIKDGAVEEAQKLGWQVDVVAAQKEGDFAGQVTVVEQEIQKGVNAIAVNPIDAKAIVTAVKDANRFNIPIFMQNTITPIEQGDVVEYIGYDQWSGAAKLAKHTCELLNGRGEVYILMGIPGFHANRRTQGYEWGLMQWCPGVKIVGKQTANWERETALNVAMAALQQYPEIDLFYGNSDEMGIGACLAAKKLGRQVNQDIRCLSIDGNDVTLELIEKGEMTATLGVYPNHIGATVIQQMNKLLGGEPIPYILETPSLVVNRDNLEAYRSGSTWTAPIEGQPELDNGLPSGEYKR